MQIPVLVEPVANNGFRAKVGQPFEITVEGVTRDEVVQKVQELIGKKLRSPGTEVVTVEVGKPWIALRGMYKDDPLFDEWQAAIAEYRQQVDEVSEIR